MITNHQQIIALLPLLIVGLTVIVVIACIAYQRNHFISAILTVIGLNLALLSLYFVIQNGPVDLSPLICIDRYSMFYTGILLLVSLAISMLAYSWLLNYPDNCDEFYLLVLIATIGGITLSCANHFATLLLGIELISLPLFGMVGYTFYQKHSLEASIKYTLLSAAASSFLMFGMSLIYADTGQLSFIGISHTIKDNTFTQPILFTGLGMMIVGIGFKLSLAPFHLWTPDVYQGSPALVSAFLATVSKIAIFVVTVRLFLYMSLTNSDVVKFVLTAIACISILFGNLMALLQSNIKRMLGYSSISNLGYLIIGLITIQNHVLALETIGVYLAGYLLASLGAFGVINLITVDSRNDEDVDSLHSYQGLFWHKPLLSFVLTVMMLSLAGIPITIGFIGKFYIIMLGIKNHLNWLTGIIIVGSAIGTFYYLRVVINLYLLPKKDKCYYSICFNKKSNITVGDIIVLISSILVVLFGLYPQPLIALVQLATPIL